VVKTKNAAEKGAKYVMIYNNVGGLTALDVDDSSLGIGMVGNELGKELISTLASGQESHAEFDISSDFQVSCRHQA
jgi:hypothetical protein